MSAPTAAPPADDSPTSLQQRLDRVAEELAAARRETALHAALDRVRALAMAAELSDETADVAVAVFNELRALGVPLLQIALCGRTDPAPETREATVWTAGIDAGGVLRASHSTQTLGGHPALDAAFEAMRTGATDVRRMTPAAFATYLRATLADYPASYADRVVERAPAAAAYHVACAPALGQAHLVAILGERPGPAHLDALERFAGLFGMSHVHNRDLRRAERLARTARIEAALERVRARVLAMRRSRALPDTIRAALDELSGLAPDLHRSGIAVMDGVAREASFWALPAHAPDAPLVAGVLGLTGGGLSGAAFETWRQQKELSYILEGETLRTHYAQVTSGADGPVATAGAEREYAHVVPVPTGVLYALSDRPFSEETVEVMQRLAGAVHLALTRFRDLEQAESQRREAVQQASVARIRAEIASMRTVADLDQITPLIGRELTALGVPFFRCAVVIVDETTDALRVYLATPDGRAQPSVRLGAEAHPVVAHVVAHWRRAEALAEVVGDGHPLADLFDAFGHAGAGAAERAMLLTPFAQGMLAVESAAPLPSEDRAAVGALAAAVAVAYARYDDYRQLEAKTAEAEQALATLRTTQEQLVQSEKLASLGSVTAGIAHEIKNPLNFVNNFALLLVDLAEELETDLAGGATHADVQDVLADMRTNAATIARHGQRADSIVRGMLQHAHGGSGTPERVGLNALVEEHAALAYHGKRAHTPGLSVDFGGQYADDAGDVVVQPQEIGRVLINLVGNALDAVHAYAATAGSAYAPRVRVRTVRTGDSVEIRVEDNGPGVPPEVAGRIFEPFFTTKPPGSGTGLGLSISHDIVVQGHGGALHVESTPGEQTAFVVTLPAVPAPPHPSSGAAAPGLS